MTADETTFCTCIEAGFFEDQVVLLAASLRALPGPLSKAPFLAIQPRPGPPISRETRRHLAELDVEYVRADLVGSYDWFNLYTKAAAMAWAETQVSTPYLTWVDGDCVFVRHPDELLPAEEFGFAAAPAESDLGTNGADGNAAYWERLAEVLGLPFDSGITMPAGDNGNLIREYYNSGVYTTHREERVAHKQREFMKRLVEAKLAARSTGTYFNDMTALSMAARTTRRPRITYSYGMNFHLQPDGFAPGCERDVNSIRILHYHASFNGMTPAVEEVIESLPEGVRELIRRHAPFRIAKLRLDRRLRRRWLTRRRMRQAQAFEKSCVHV